MTNKLPTVDIKGKKYVMVKDRILAFNEIFINGCIQTELISAPDATTVIVKAIVTPDYTQPDRKFMDYSQAVIGQGLINTTSALENCSTSAVGRALAYMGIGVIESVASADEVFKAMNQGKSATTTDRQEAQSEHYCKVHSKDLKERIETDGRVWDHRMQIDGVWNRCYGMKWIPSIG